MNLFRLGDFTLASGKESPFKIDCDALSPSDWAALAKLAAGILPPFSIAIGVPTGGSAFAEALNEHRANDPGRLLPILLCDDVLTTGGSMERMRLECNDLDIIGVVAFARGECPNWVTPLFSLFKRP
jgi:orotate phosphoribosyltransferase